MQFSTPKHLDIRKAMLAPVTAAVLQVGELNE